MSWQQELWPEWRIENQIGSGSCGSVYKITKEDASGVYYSALKVIVINRSEAIFPAQYCEGDAKTVDYFSFAKEVSREINLMEKLKGNTNIVSYEDHKIVFQEEEKCWIILLRMELLKTLEEYFQNNECAECDVIRMGEDICRALELCEREGIIHRDIKPGNIFVSEFGDYKLGDFSIALITKHSKTEHDPVGTYYYMAPEVYYKKEYNKTVDLYSLALIMYRLLNQGNPPFLEGMEQITESAVEFANARRLKGEAIPPPGFASKKVADIILKACSFLPEERYQSAAEMRKALHECTHTSQERKEKTQSGNSYFKIAGDIG